MVSTAGNPGNSRYRTPYNEGYDGVVRITVNGYSGSGALLYDGRAVLTAAHLFTSGSSSSAQVSFATAAGSPSIGVRSVLLHPGYDEDSNNDLAIVWLQRPAPLLADRYTIYRSADEIGQSFEFVGYGASGSGASGWQERDSAASQRLRAMNTFDADAALLKTRLGAAIAWKPLPGTQLLADFDSGKAANDALGILLGSHDLGLGIEEGLIAPGDSGGPAFIDGMIAGIASYTASLSRGSQKPDADGKINSSFGEIAAWQRVSAFEQWIDQSLRARYPDAPSRPEEVEKAVKEGDSGSSLAYFLLQFTGTRASPEQILSVDYATRDGTAQAGSDYLPVRGTLKLYPGEDQAVIAVEIVGDSIAEADEYFFLDVFNPQGGSFGDGVSVLSAMRTIIDDDALPGWA